MAPKKKQAATKDWVRNQLHKRGEVKYIETAVTGGGADTTGSVFQLSAVAQGITDTARIGEEIVMESLQIRGHIRSNRVIGSDVDPNMVRMVVIQDMSDLNAAPAIAGVWTTVTDFYQNNLRIPASEIMERYKVLMDRWIVLGPTDSVGGAHQVIKGFKYFLRRRIKINYTGAAATAVAKGNLYFFIASDHATGVEEPTYVLDVVMRFRDPS